MLSHSRKDKFIKVPVFIVSLSPFLLLVFHAATSGLGANPIEKGLHKTGDWALNFLLITLAVSPVNTLTGFHWSVRLRRMLGLFCYFYATLHVATYVGLEHFFDWNAIISDISQHKRILIGLISYIMLIPLALTSTNRMVQKLGGARWRSLHGLVYLASAGGVIHFLWLVKIDILAGVQVSSQA
jgi:sulfoxide reductase heme-binding subunit YedZ